MQILLHVTYLDKKFYIAPRLDLKSIEKIKINNKIVSKKSWYFLDRGLGVICIFNLYFLQITGIFHSMQVDFWYMSSKRRIKQKKKLKRDYMVSYCSFLMSFWIKIFFFKSYRMLNISWLRSGSVTRKFRIVTLENKIEDEDCLRSQTMTNWRKIKTCKVSSFLHWF